MINTILFYVTIWYVFWFIVRLLTLPANIDLPKLTIKDFDLVGDNIFTFLPSFIYQVHFWLSYFNVDVLP